MKLTNRLQVAADLITKGKRIGDVGSDHGYLPIYLVENKIVKKAIASDINVGPVQNAKKAIKGSNLIDDIDIRLGGGLLPYELGEIDIAVIAGMGGLLIRDIMVQSQKLVDSLDYLVVQPMTMQKELREWLIKNDYTIFNEKITREGNKFYEVFCVKKGKMNVSDDAIIEIGIDAIKADDGYSIEFLDFKIRKYELIIKNIGDNPSGASIEAKVEAEKMLEKLKEVKKNVCKR
jgi:tRNA (adenine22-N1)-methyltransferase